MRPTILLLLLLLCSCAAPRKPGTIRTVHVPAPPGMVSQSMEFAVMVPPPATNVTMLRFYFTSTNPPARAYLFVYRKNSLSAATWTKTFEISKALWLTNGLHAWKTQQFPHSGNVGLFYATLADGFAQYETLPNQ